MDGWRIGELAKATGASVRSIRHYDALGLLTPDRAENRYRAFRPEDADRVRLIRLFLSVGFTLDEVRRFAPCFKAEGATLDAHAGEIEVFYARKLAEVDERLAALTELRARLARQLGAVRARPAGEPLRPVLSPAP